jgi:hypothetical protein
MGSSTRRCEGPKSPPLPHAVGISKQIWDGSMGIRRAVGMSHQGSRSVTRLQDYGVCPNGI